MEWKENPLVLDTAATKQEIVTLLQDRFRFLNRKLAIIGLSGGLDSSTTAALTVESLGAENVRLIYIPERDSKPIHKKHARIVARSLGVELTVFPITPALRSLHIYSLLPLNFIPGRWLKSRAVDYGRSRFLARSGGEFLSIRLTGSGGTWVSRGNAYACAKHRVRNVVLYKEAESLGGMVVGAANKTEWMTGTFTQFGCDHNADVMPLLHLYRSQVEILAEYLNIPDEIRFKKADPDILPGLSDKGKLLGSFAEADQILWGLENQINLSDLESQFGSESVAYIQALINNSVHYREAPYSLL